MLIIFANQTKEIRLCLKEIGEGEGKQKGEKRRRKKKGNLT